MREGSWEKKVENVRGEKKGGRRKVREKGGRNKGGRKEVAEDKGGRT